MYRIREDHSRQYLAALSFSFCIHVPIPFFFRDIISTFRAFYFVLYGDGATGSCRVEYPIFLTYRLSANATRVRGAWKIDKNLTGGAHWACCNGFM